jgi:hypothetical protein
LNATCAHASVEPLKVLWTDGSVELLQIVSELDPRRTVCDVSM